MMLQEKPTKGSLTEAKVLAEFARQARALNWHKAFQKLGPETLLIIDRDVRAVLEENFGAFACHHRVPDSKKKVPEGISRRLYLTRSAEWQRVKAARAHTSGSSVISLMYDVAPMGVLSSGEFPAAVDHTPSAGAIMAPNLLLTMPGSDGEYLRLMLEKNGLGTVAPTGGRLLAYWLLLCDKFHILRFAAHVFDRQQQQGGALWLDMYLLYMIYHHTSLRAERFLAWFDEAGGHMLYFISRDKVRQAAVNQMLASETYFSLWDRAASRIAELTPQQFDRPAAIERLTDAIELETLLEPNLEKIKNFKMMTLEDLVEVPEAVLTAIALFWGGEPARRIKAIDWRARYNLLPEFLAEISILREDVNIAFDLDPKANGSSG